MIVTKMALPRRTVLRGVGAVLSLPFLEAMVPALAAAPTRVKRVGFFYNGMGQLPQTWDPVGEGTAFELGPTMKEALGPVRNKTIVVTGLMNKGGESTGDAGGTHTRCGSAWLSGVKPKQSEADLLSGKTADQYAADVLGRSTRLPSVELSISAPGGGKTCDTGYSCLYQNTMSWRTPTQPNPMERSPREAFERLFGEGGTPEERAARLRSRRSVLDRLTEDLTQLTRRLGAGDRVALDSYLSDVRTIEERIQRAEAQAFEVPLPFEPPVSIPASYDEYATLMYDILAVALQADVTRVATFQIVRELYGGSYPQIGLNDGHHTLSHYGNDPQRQADYAKLNIYQIGFFGRFVQKLESMREGDGSVLDNALFVYGSGMSNSDTHDPANVPTVLVGGAGGSLRGGRVIRYDNTKETPFTNLLLTVLDVSGVPVKRLGDSTGQLAEVAAEPLSF